ncbi:MAG: SDR family NAD(P)-dependent oxidoreductase [Fervidicoccaceae archaeon]
MSFRGRVAIVTGSAMGIGKAIALRLASDGANVALYDLSERVRDVAEEVESVAGTRALAFVGDVSVRSEVEEAVNKVLERFGKIDILVNNAGIYPFKPFVQMSEEEWDKVMNVNLKGVFYFTKAVLPSMMSNRYGRIINVSSIAGSVIGFPNLVHYCASKAAIVGLTKALALEVAPYNITVNAIAPGPIETPGTRTVLVDEELKLSILKQIPLGRLGAPADVAEVAAFLASEKAGFITGQLFIVDGGYSAH